MGVLLDSGMPVVETRRFRLCIDELEGMADPSRFLSGMTPEGLLLISVCSHGWQHVNEIDEGPDACGVHIVDASGSLAAAYGEKVTAGVWYLEGFAFEIHDVSIESFRRHRRKVKLVADSLTVFFEDFISQ